MQPKGLPSPRVHFNCRIRIVVDEYWYLTDVANHLTRYVTWARCLPVPARPDAVPALVLLSREFLQEFPVFFRMHGVDQVLLVGVVEPFGLSRQDRTRVLTLPHVVRQVLRMQVGRRGYAIDCYMPLLPVKTGTTP